MSRSRTLSISTKDGEAALLSYTAEHVKQDGNVIILSDKNGEPAVEIRLLDGVTVRILGLSATREG